MKVKALSPEFIRAGRNDDPSWEVQKKKQEKTSTLYFPLPVPYFIHFYVTFALKQRRLRMVVIDMSTRATPPEHMPPSPVLCSPLSQGKDCALS
jgi:hypothetical protein